MYTQLRTLPSSHKTNLPPTQAPAHKTTMKFLFSSAVFIAILASASSIDSREAGSNNKLAPRDVPSSSAWLIKQIAERVAVTKDDGEATPEKAKEDKTEAEKEVGDSHYIFFCLADTHLDTIASVAQEKTKETKGEKGTTKKDDTEDKAPAEPKTNDEPVKEDDVSSYLM